MAQGYTVAMIGKYLNNCPDSDHVPDGFDVYFANGGGTYYAPQFAAKNLDWYGIPDGSFQGNNSVYTTEIVGNVSVAWIKRVIGSDKVVSSLCRLSANCHPCPSLQPQDCQHHPDTTPPPAPAPTFSQPFAAFIHPKACHEPFLPSPTYKDYWDPSWPAHEPRPVSWNCSAEARADHHHVIATEPMISDTAAQFITQVGAGGSVSLCMTGLHP